MIHRYRATWPLFLSFPPYLVYYKMRSELSKTFLPSFESSVLKQLPYTGVTFIVFPKFLPPLGFPAVTGYRRREEIANTVIIPPCQYYTSFFVSSLLSHAASKPMLYLTKPLHPVSRLAATMLINSFVIYFPSWWWG